MSKEESCKARELNPPHPSTLESHLRLMDRVPYRPSGLVPRNLVMAALQFLNQPCVTVSPTRTFLISLRPVAI